MKKLRRETACPIKSVNSEIVKVSTSPVVYLTLHEKIRYLTLQQKNAIVSHRKRRIAKQKIRSHGSLSLFLSRPTRAPDIVSALMRGSVRRREGEGASTHGNASARLFAV